MATTSSRRAILGGLAAFTGTAGTATAAAIAIEPAEPDASQPDAELLAAERRWQEAVSFKEEAERRAGAAGRAEEELVGPCPPELFTNDHDYKLTRVSQTRENPFRWENWHTDPEGAVAQSWTGSSLRAAMAAAPTVYGRGGRTPHVIRELRALLPIAEVRDAAWERAKRQFGADELARACAPARDAVNAAEEQIIGLPAVTIVGAAVKARFAKRWLAKMAEGRSFDLKPPECMMAVLAAVLDISGSSIEPGRPQ